MSNDSVRVHFIDGSTRIVSAKGIHFVGEEGAKSAIALDGDREVPIYNRSDWPDPWLWYEQISYEQFQQMKDTLPGDGEEK